MIFQGVFINPFTKRAVTSSHAVPLGGIGCVFIFVFPLILQLYGEKCCDVITDFNIYLS